MASVSRPLGTAALLVAPALAQSTTLDFAQVTSNEVAWDYGDYVESSSTGGYTYTGTGGFTPHVHVTLGSEENGIGEPLFTWATGYNDLVDVMYASVSGTDAHVNEIVVTLSAEPGYLASLEAFDIGNWGAAVTLPYVRVFDETGLLLYEDLDVFLEPNTSPIEKNYAFSPVLEGRVVTLRVSVQGLFGLADNVGLDNLQFGERTDAGNGVGTPYCQAADNSTRNAGRLTALGSASVSSGDLELLASGLPVNTFGFFIASRQSGLVVRPGGSSGNLCLSGAIGRYVGPGQIQNTIGTGILRLPIDLASIPSPTGPVAASAGESWYFQAWHRDTIGGSATSNFTEALQVDLVQ
ncbi:MAG: hypothetical protein AAGG01_01465 [Planctomycetota bacterium]